MVVVMLAGALVMYPVLPWIDRMITSTGRPSPIPKLILMPLYDRVVARFCSGWVFYTPHPSAYWRCEVLPEVAVVWLGRVVVLTQGALLGAAVLHFARRMKQVLPG